MISPIQITLLNDHHLPILFLPDGAQNLLIEVQNNSGGDVVFDQQKQFHLQLLLRPKTLREPRKTLQLVKAANGFPSHSDLQTAAREGSNWNDPVIADDIPGPFQGVKGFVTVSLKANGRAPLKHGERLLLMLSGATPEATSQGTRISRVEIKHSLVPGLTLPEVAHLHLLNISQFAFLAEDRDNSITSARSQPFAAAFVGSNQVLNDNTTETTLTIRILNIQDAPLNVSANSELEISWFLTGFPGALTDTGRMTVDAPQQAFWKPVDAITESGGIGRRKMKPVAIASPFQKNQPSLLNLSFTVPAAIQSGFAPLILEWRNLPDAADGQLTLLVQIGGIAVDQTDPDITRIVSAKPLRFDTADAVEMGSFSATASFLTMRTAGGNRFRSGIRLRVFNDQLGFDIENDERHESNGLNISRLTAGGTFTSLFIDKQNGNVGVATTSPRSRLEVLTDAPGETPVLTLTNQRGGLGTAAALDFYTFKSSFNASARIEAIDVGYFSNDILFLVNRPGAANNGLVERMRMNCFGQVGIGTKEPNPNSKLEVAGNIAAKGLLIGPSWSLTASGPDLVLTGRSSNFTTETTFNPDGSITQRRTQGGQTKVRTVANNVF